GCGAANDRRVRLRAWRRDAAARRGRATASARRRDRAAHRGARGPEDPARFRGRRRHPDCPRRAWHPARRQSRRHALETKVKRPDPSERRESRVPDIRTELPGPKARDIIARDRAAVSTSYTRDYPFVIARGSGAV